MSKIIELCEFKSELAKGLMWCQHNLGIKSTKEAFDLLLMTALHESGGLRYNRQINGPALSLFQIEPDTYYDTFKSYLFYRPEKLNAIVDYFGKDGLDDFEEMSVPKLGTLMNNIVFSTVMARLHYYRVPEALPKKGSPEYLYSLAKYCKKHFNRTGKATPEKYLNDYVRYNRP